MRGGVATQIEQERIWKDKKQNTCNITRRLPLLLKEANTHATCHAVTTAFVKRAVTTASSLNNWLAVTTAASSHNQLGDDYRIPPPKR